MPPALDENIKDRVRALWFAGETRKNIAAECQIGAGSVTNIVDDWKNGIEKSGLEWIRELAVQLRKEGTTLVEFASIYRRNNYIKKLDANEEQIESLISNLLKSSRSIPQEKIVDLVNQLHELSESDSIPPVAIPAYVKQKIEEKHTLEEEIRKSRLSLDQENIKIEIIEEYKKLKEELNKRGISIGDPRRFASVLQTIDRIGNEPRKIIRELEQIKSLKQTERRLKKNCGMWESRATQYKEIIPMCEQVVSRGDLGISLLMALHAAVLKKTEESSVPPNAAPIQVLQEIEDYKRLGGIKKQLLDTFTQLNITKEFLGRQNDAINTLMKLQLSGMTEDQILRICRAIEVNSRG
jgi:hypothetical protein